MRCLRAGLLFAISALLLVISLRPSLKAQDRPATAPATSPLPPPGATTAKPGTITVRDALEKPFAFPFRKPTALEAVCRHLRLALNAPVVLDLAALARQDVRPDDEVQLELDGVRLKTGLKLLLDQVGLSYSVVPEDNLLIVTDSAGAENTIDRVLSELKALHRDMHDLQDSVDDLRAQLGLDDAAGPRVRKPTIIEEMPAKPNAKPEEPPAKPQPQPRSRLGL
jgi:hypothetical protein